MGKLFHGYSPGGKSFRTALRTEGVISCSGTKSYIFIELQLQSS